MITSSNLLSAFLHWSCMQLWPVNYQAQVYFYLFIRHSLTRRNEDLDQTETSCELIKSALSFIALSMVLKCLILEGNLEELSFWKKNIYIYIYIYIFMFFPYFILFLKNGNFYYNDYYYYILIIYEKVLVLCKIWLFIFSSGLDILRPLCEKTIFTPASVCLSLWKTRKARSTSTPKSYVASIKIKGSIKANLVTKIQI